MKSSQTARYEAVASNYHSQSEYDRYISGLPWGPSKPICSTCHSIASYILKLPFDISQLLVVAAETHLPLNLLALRKQSIDILE